MSWLRAVAFDSIGTCLSLEPLRPRLVGLGLQASDLELWFARSLRDGFACECAGRFLEFKIVLASTLRSLLIERGLPDDQRRIDAVVDGFSELPVHPDVAAAFELVREAGLKLAILTNGSAQATRQAFARADLKADEIVSVDEVRHFKPANEVYLHAARKLSVRPGRLALVAAHSWDVHGARRAGLEAVFVRRDEAPSTALLEDGVSGTLPEAVERLLAISRPRPMRWIPAIAAATAGALLLRRRFAAAQ
jgi:2-haloacid dehalogenase